MVEVLEQDVAPDTVEATVNYLLYTGETPYTYSGGPGSTEVRHGGKSDPHRWVVQHGRRQAAELPLY